jgi:serine/threonine protein kinase
VQGSFGRVYHAVWLGTDIAVKVIPDIEGEGLISVWREIVILRKLRHPNIVLFMAAVEAPSSREVSDRLVVLCLVISCFFLVRV